MTITLKQKKINEQKASLFIEFYKGSYRTEEGKLKHNRELEYLKLYVWLEPKTPTQRQDNKDALAEAENILAIKKAENLTRKFGLANPHKGKVRLLDYFETIKEKRSGYLANYGVWQSTKRYISEFFHPSLTFNELTVELSIRDKITFTN